VAAPVGNALPIVPGYTLERELGRGTLGITYLGRRKAREAALVAIKVVQPSVPGSPAHVAEFLQAAQPLTRLDHPHLVSLREVGASESGLHFVAEYVNGRSAAAVLAREGRLSVERTLHWADQFLQALQYAHDQGFVHHEIKPTNLLVSEMDGAETVKLADFGLARVYQSAPFSGLTITAAMLSLADFMPPELLFNYNEANPLADQYSAAALIYHLLTDTPLVDLPKDRKRQHTSLLRRHHVPIGERRPDLPVALADAIHKALSRTPAQRYATIGDFRQSLLASAAAEA
jgi:eukaryotic-like serine/threonine-protein kinase